MLAAEGYYNNGIIHMREPLTGISNYRRVIVTVLDEEVKEDVGDEIKKRLEKWAEFDALVAEVEEKPSIENFPRFNFGRELIEFDEV